MEGYLVQHIDARLRLAAWQNANRARPVGRNPDITEKFKEKYKDPKRIQHLLLGD